MSYIKIKNLVEHNSTITTFNYIKKYDNPIHYIYIKTKSKEWSNIQFNLTINYFDDNDEIIISDDKNPSKTINIKSSKNPFTINACIKKHSNLTIQINSSNKKLSLSITNLKTLYEAKQPIIINKIFIINLKRKTDRKQLMIKRLTSSNITNYEFIEAIDGKTDEIQQQYEQYKKSGSKFVSVGHFACLLSHIKALETAKQQGNLYNLILEDDVIFRNNFLEIINEINVPIFDVLYFGGLTKENKLYVNGWAETKNAMGLYAYMVNFKNIDKIIDLFKTKKTYCDRLMVTRIQESNDYKIILLNDVIYTSLEDTDTSNKTSLVYKLIENQMNRYV